MFPFSIAEALHVHRVAVRRLVRGCLLAGLVLIAACGAQAPPPPPQGPGDWHAFSGTWTATGTRYTLQLAGTQTASIATFEGSLMLEGPARPDIGFRAEAVVFTDSATGMTGRAVWTDERGDRVFSELAGTTVAGGNRVVGTFTGGTGRYEGAEGTYEFAWRFLLAAEDGTVQGQSQGLRGRVRSGAREGARP